MGINTSVLVVIVVCFNCTCNNSAAAKVHAYSFNVLIVERYSDILQDLKKDPESHGGPPDCIVSLVSGW